jgi:hypothetical protein
VQGRAKTFLFANFADGATQEKISCEYYVIPSAGQFADGKEKLWTTKDTKYHEGVGGGIPSV